MKVTHEQLSQIAAAVGERSGWDFSRMRTSREPVPWDYLELAPRYLKPTDVILDVGTGGGEKFLAFAPHVSFGVGIDLDPAMIRVARVNAAGRENVSFATMGAEALALPDGAFDVVLTRHAPVEVAEVVRVLRPGGYFVSQQVGARNMANIRRAFATGSDTQYNVEERARIDGFTRLGCEIVATGAYDVRYWVEDIPSLVFWLRAIAGANEVPAGFTIERDWRTVSRIIARYSTARGIETNEHRTLLIVRKREANSRGAR